MASKNNKNGIPIGIDKDTKSEKQKTKNTKDAMTVYNSALKNKITKGK